MRALPPDAALLTALERRVGRLHARLRLGIEAEHEAQVFGQGRTFFHIENWYSIHGLMRGVLRLLGLHERGRRNARDIRLTVREVGLPALPEAFAGFRLLHLSDLHLDMHPDLPQAIVEAVRQVECDACVITGDFRARTFGPIEPALEGLARVRAVLPEPVFAVLGNHDSLTMVPGIEALGIRVLMNEACVVERQGAQLHLVGVDDPHYYALDNLEKATAALPPESCSILLAHSAEIWRQAAHAGIASCFVATPTAGRSPCPVASPSSAMPAPHAACARGPGSIRGCRATPRAGRGSHCSMCGSTARPR